ncbi:glucose-1-phosphate cytidylyltransferase [Alphaproteobacteria bacterium]|nr:glucose-1-phosphate cytidylyltransferase [Alphaproteobacteria bacterium]
MKAVILAGGLGSRLAEETTIKPKPMVEIDGRPLLWHIMKHYSHYGINDFIICCGYKAEIIKNYFINYQALSSDFSVSLDDGKLEMLRKNTEPWRVSLIDTGVHSMTGGRLKRVAKYLEGEGTFCMTYGDGLGDVDIAESIKFHHAHGRYATLTAVHPIARFGSLQLDGAVVKNFAEKPKGTGQRISAGFFVLSAEVLSYIDDDSTVWEQGPLEKLARDDQLRAYFHDGFWQPMDTLRDRMALASMADSGSAPWKVWA